MIAVVLSILIALSSGVNPCTLGNKINWIAWRDTYAADAQLVMTLSATANTPDVWLYEDSAGEYVLFVFAQPIDAAVIEGETTVHGDCARTL